MSKAPVSDVPPQSENRLLALLPPDDYRRLLPLLQPVTLPFRQVLHKPRRPADFVYFPTRGVASAVNVMQGGGAIEVANVGKEGATGIASLLGLPAPTNEVFMQVAGEGLRAESDALAKEAVRDGPLWKVLAAYHAFYLAQVSQSVACNGLHTVQQRCCRWLLMTHDRVGTDEMSLTHEFLGVMLGVRRATVSIVLQPLKEQGMIRYGRGKIIVLDRSGLEANACECHQVLRDEYDRLLG